jgi:hypothetical protein
MPAFAPALARDRAPAQTPPSRARPAPGRDPAAAVGGVLRQPGNPLALATLAFYSHRFGRDFSDVRVHTGAAAAASAAAVNARAYAVGRHVVLGAGHAPSHAGADGRLMAHELAHVVQQGGAEAPADTSRLAASGPAAESAARTASDAIARGDAAPPQPAAGPQLARDTPAPAAAPYTPPLAGRYEHIGPQEPAPPAPAPPPKPQPQPPPPRFTTRTKQPGDSGKFENPKTAALKGWHYVVYQDHVRIGNCTFDETGNVIGAWPWLTNNPGDLTGNVAPVKMPDGNYRQERRIWGQRNLSGPSPDKMQENTTLTPLSAGNTAIAGKAARTDLGVFATEARGRAALKEWIQNDYADLTLAASPSRHLGGGRRTSVDNDADYTARLRQLLTARGYPANYVDTTHGKDIPRADVKPAGEAQWEDVLDAYAFAEGVLKMANPDTAEGRKTFERNEGFSFNCAGRMPTHIYTPYQKLNEVKQVEALSATPDDIKAMLPCPLPAGTP